MKLPRTFQILIATAWLLQLFSYVLPIQSWYADPVSSRIMSVDGYGAALSLGIPFLNTFPLWAFLFATIGMFFFRNWGRYLYLALWTYGLCSTLLFGIRVILPLQGFLGMALGTLDGAILALAFLSPLRAAFAGSVALNVENDAGSQAGPSPSP